MNPSQLDEFGVPVLNADDIELKAEEVIAYYDPDLLNRPALVPLLKFIERLHSEHSLARDYSQDLGVTKNGHKILGKTRIRPLGLFVDISLANDSRFNFVLGHELGHVVLHRRVDVKRTGYDDQEMSDTEIDLLTGRKILRTPRDWLEWQAKRFASAILMPRATVRRAVVEAQSELGINNNIGMIVLENVGYSFRDYEAVRRQIELIYDVNATNAEYRLKELGILVDRRDLNTRHISELFASE